MCQNSAGESGTPEKMVHEEEASRTSMSGTLVIRDGRIRFWSDSVDTAEAKKAEGASFTALLIPKPPALTGGLACDHWTSSKSMFKIFVRPSLRTMSYFSNR